MPESSTLLNYSLSFEPKAALSTPYLILIHGLFGDLDNLNSIRRGLQEHYRVINIDLRNHGQSPWSEQMDFDLMVQDLVQLFEHLKIERAHILGHSLGGKVAMHFALQYPSKTKALIVADIAPVAYTPSHLTIFKALRSLDLSQIQNRQAAEQHLAETIKEAGVRQFLLKNLRSTDSGWQWRMNLEALYANYETLIGTPFTTGCYTGPTLFIRGGRSNYIQPEHTSLIRTYFPQAQIETIADTGHWLHAEKPTTFNQLVQGFLDENSANL